jgi:hypothetical protein
VHAAAQPTEHAVKANADERLPDADGEGVAIGP